MRRQSSVAENMATLIAVSKNGKIVETLNFDQLLLSSIDEALIYISFPFGSNVI
jgi:hypothetical protein